jgi:dihydroxy-acid dehydratase
MNGVLEALGMMPLGLSTLPVDSKKRMTLSREAGKRIVAMVAEDLKPASVLTVQAFQNAIAVCMALGGSTNAVIHLTAIAGRLDIPVYPDLFNAMGEKVPCIADVQPAGKNLVDAFDKAGGIPVLMRQLGELINRDVITYTGKKLKTLLHKTKVSDDLVIRKMSDPVMQAPTISILFGNIAPLGAVIKVAAASPHLLQHSGTAFVFDSYEEMLNSIDDENLPVDASTVLVLRNAGPKAVPGMPEWGMLPIPKKLRRQGIEDMLRISDARMSGTSFGTVILDVAPEAALGGTFALIRTGDRITVDIPNRKLNADISDAELAERKAAWSAPQVLHTRGYPKLFIREVLQADEGCDFDFLKPRSDAGLLFIEPVVGRS